MTWPEPVERVAFFLRNSGAEARLEEVSTEDGTAAAAADAVGCTLGQIVKTLVLTCDGQAVVALVAGDRRADTSKIARLLGVRRAAVARSAEVQAATGFAPGAVAPFPLPGVESVLVDRSLLRHALVWAGGGSSQHLVAIAPLELVRLTQGRVEEIGLLTEAAPSEPA